MNPFMTGPASREYQLSTFGWFLLYGLLLLGVAYAHDQGLLAGPGRYVAAVLPALPIAGFLWTVLRFMHRSDEFVRAILAKTFIVAIHVTLFVCVAWGFLETYAQAPHLPLYWAFVVFWASVGVAGRFVRSSR